jgi:hypothetical protein
VDVHGEHLGIAHEQIRVLEHRVHRSDVAVQEDVVVQLEPAPDVLSGLISRDDVGDARVAPSDHVGPDGEEGVVEDSRDAGDAPAVG